MAKSEWAGKPAGVIGVSIGAIGTSLAQQHLRNILAYLNVPTPGQPEAFIRAKEGSFDDNGNVGPDVGPDSLAFMQEWMTAYAARVRLYAE